MRLYKYHPASNDWNSYQIDLAIEQAITKLHFKAERVGAQWKPLSLNRLENDIGPNSDFPSLSNFSEIPIVSLRAWEVLKPIIGESVEALPALAPDGDYLLLNVLELIDCLDQERSEVTRNRVTNRVSRVFRYSFHYPLLIDKHIFKTPSSSGAELFVDDVFRKSVESNGLVGLRFNELEYVDPPPI